MLHNRSSNNIEIQSELVVIVFDVDREDLAAMCQPVQIQVSFIIQKMATTNNLYFDIPLLRRLVERIICIDFLRSADTCVIVRPLLPRQGILANSLKKGQVCDKDVTKR